MIHLSQTPPTTVYFLSKTGNSSITEYIKTEKKYNAYQIRFEELKTQQIELTPPDLMVVDLYFNSENTDRKLERIMEKFTHCKLYFISPKFAQLEKYDYQQNNQHYFSCFSNEVISDIKNFIDQNTCVLGHQQKLN